MSTDVQTPSLGSPQKADCSRSPEPRARQPAAAGALPGGPERLAAELQRALGPRSCSPPRGPARQGALSAPTGHPNWLLPRSCSPPRSLSPRSQARAAQQAQQAVPPLMLGAPQAACLRTESPPPPGQSAPLPPGPAAPFGLLLGPASRPASLTLPPGPGVVPSRSLALPPGRPAALAMPRRSLVLPPGSVLLPPGSLALQPGSLAAHSLLAAYGLDPAGQRQEFRDFKDRCYTFFESDNYLVLRILGKFSVVQRFFASRDL